MTRKLTEMSVKEIESVIAQINLELAELNSTRKRKLVSLTDAQNELAARKTKKTTTATFSDHALLRYMERAMGFNVEGLRRKLLTPVVVSALEAGCASITVDGIKMLVRDKTVVTCVD